jgi:hypothetical protein
MLHIFMTLVGNGFGYTFLTLRSGHFLTQFCSVWKASHPLEEEREGNLS